MAGCCSDEHKPEAVSNDVCCDPNEAIKCSSATASTVNAVAGSRLSSFRIAQMDCPTEQSLIQDKLSKLAGVDKLDFNLIKRILGVWHNLPSTAPIEEAILSLGMQAEPLSAEGQARIKIEQMDCPTEEKLIRDKLSSVPGISALEFNLLQRVLTFSHTAEALPAALAAIRDLGFTPVVEDSATANEEAQGTPRKKAWWPLALSGVAAVSAEVIHFAELAPDWAVAGVALLAILLCGLTTYKGLDRAEEPQPEHQCADEYRGDRCGADWAMARSGHGHVPLFCSRTDRSEVIGSGSPCHPRPDGSDAGARHGAADRWHMA